MGKYKPLKQSVYFKRYQVAYRRRREGKTDYRARLKLTVQAKNKYNTPKYRFVVRFTKTDIICQIVYATMVGDACLCAAYSHELPRYGMPAGLTNWSAAYATGLLLARRVLKKLGLDEIYEGNTEAEELGKDYTVEAADDEKRPFTCLLDTGLKRTSTGSKIFGALKGALDGGLNIPHGIKRFVGYDADAKELDDETLQKYCTGGHVAEYAEMMQEEDPDKYKTHFAKYLENDIDVTDMEELFNSVHEAIRENPDMEKKERKPSDGKKWKMEKLSLEERKANLKEKLNALIEANAGDEDSDSD